jgi:hypothetical protein
LSGRTLRLSSGALRIGMAERGLQLSFSEAGDEPMVLGNLPGTRHHGVARDGGLRIHRDLFLSDDRQTAGLRIVLRNESTAPVRLGEARIISVDRQADFIVGAAGVDEWSVLRYPFHKSDIPCCYRPTVVDKDFTDAVFSCMNAVPGKGVLYNTVNTESRSVSSGPLMIVGHRSRRDLPRLMLAITDIRNHYIQQILTTNQERTGFAEFSVVCDFLDVQLAPGAETETHWLLITTDVHESRLLERFARTIADIHRLTPPRKPSPTVYCTWYFYTFLVSEAYVLEELEAIRARHVPLDVFQIDDGWMDTYGTYEPHPVKFPHGMAWLADRIRAEGMVPGIWAAPFVIDAASPVVRQYPEMFQKDAAGNRIIFETDRDCYVLDPTAPGADAYLQSLCAKLKGWGFRYFKFDWLRAIYELPHAVLHNRGINRLGGYHHAMRVIREALGPDAFILACGGLSDPGALSLVDGQRTSKDVRGIWNGPEGVPKSGAVIQLKQNLLRNYVNRFYHTDPDATQIRIRKERFSEAETKCVGVYQSEGHYTDEEARTICTHQFLCGGMVTISERFPELQDERLAMLRHISPAITPPARILDYDAPGCPTLFLTEVSPACRVLGDYRILTLGNWEDEPVTRRVTLDGLPGDHAPWAPRVAVFEFHTQRLLGCFAPDEPIELLLPPHAVRVLRIVDWDGRLPVVLGTDLHLSGGAAEIKELTIGRDAVRGQIETRWRYPVIVTVGFPDGAGGCVVKACQVPVGGGAFEVAASGKAVE